MKLEMCPRCSGDMLAEDRYEYGDGCWLVCEDCGHDVPIGEPFGRLFAPFEPHEATPLALTLPKPHQGTAGTAVFSAGRYPACSEHGAMNRVAPAHLWRCLACNIGVELSADVV